MIEEAETSPLVIGFEKDLRNHQPIFLMVLETIKCVALESVLLGLSLINKSFI